MKVKLKGAQRGHDLLKKKADALALRFRVILKNIKKVPRVFAVIGILFLPQKTKEHHDDLFQQKKKEQKDREGLGYPWRL